MKTQLISMAALALALPTAAQAAPGLGDEVYGATVTKGELEIEGRYGRLGGGPDNGEDALKVEAGYGVTDRLRVAVVGEFEKEAGDTRRATAMSAEAIYALGKVAGISVALYGEYEVGLVSEPDKLEGKILLERVAGPWDFRLNLIGERQFVDGAPLRLGYAASADVAAVGDIRLGVQAYGDLGTFHRLAPRAEHFIGPVAKFEVEGLGPELGIELGYLFAAGAARDDTKGQLRVLVEMEF